MCTCLNRHDDIWSKRYWKHKIIYKRIIVFGSVFQCKWSNDMRLIMIHMRWYPHCTSLHSTLQVHITKSMRSEGRTLAASFEAPPPIFVGEVKEGQGARGQGPGRRFAQNSMPGTCSWMIILKCQASFFHSNEHKWSWICWPTPLRVGFEKESEHIPIYKLSGAQVIRRLGSRSLWEFPWVLQ